MPRFGVEQQANGYYVVVDHSNNDKVCFKTADKALAERQAAHLQPRNPTGHRPDYLVNPEIMKVIPAILSGKPGSIMDSLTESIEDDDVMELEW